MKKKLFLLFLSLYVFFPLKAQTSSEGLNRIIDKVREEHDIPEITAAVIETDKIFYGISGIPRTVKSDIDILKSKIHLGTNSKTITSFIAMKMIEDGKISLDAKLGETVAELSSMNNSHMISLGDLLTNTSSVDAYDKEKDFKKMPSLSGSLFHKMTEFSRIALEKRSGDKTFSNAGYVMAALMLEKVANTPFNELLRKVLEEDLKLSCFTSVPDKTQLQNFWGSWGDSNLQIAHFASNPHLNSDYMVAAEGISMDIVDYSKIIQLSLNGLLGDNNYLNNDKYTLLHFNSDEYSYGWKNGILNTYKISFHENESTTYFLHAVIVPSNKIAIIIMSRKRDDSSKEGIYALRDILIENYSK
ncbi:serine hydrolase domain-containing protein [Abyssalbus ytuae]|uniref:Serine hydrolase n=1 Tax=Abyssalbus ytuae TaxID=2926907 RepID=A0A9E7D3Y4_9FLAO|nr:serine hydrolase [Abyssalbus ytuae]UOB18324.1 serine hydrolase [Abyssalbus ytuae]